MVSTPVIIAVAFAAWLGVSIVVGLFVGRFLALSSDAPARADEDPGT